MGLKNPNSHSKKKTSLFTPKLSDRKGLTMTDAELKPQGGQS